MILALKVFLELQLIQEPLVKLVLQVELVRPELLDLLVTKVKLVELEKLVPQERVIQDQLEFEEKQDSPEKLDPLEKVIRDQWE